MMDMYIQPLKLEIKLEQDVELCGVNKWDVETDSQKTVDVPNRSGPFPFQDEYLYPEEFKIKLEDDSSEMDLLRNTDVTKVLKNISNERLKEEIKQEEHTNESVSNQKSISQDGRTCSLDNIKLETMNQMLTEVAEAVHDSNYQTVNAGVTKNLTDDSMKFSDGNNCQLLKFVTDYSNQPVLDVFTDRRVPQEMFECPLCLVIFTDNEQLMTHKQIHTGDILEKDYHKIPPSGKPFKCNDCGFSFSESANLKKHQKIHTGEKPFKYKCDICCFSFTQNDHLEEHNRIHTGEKPYKCDVCGLAFMKSDYLKIHTKIHSGEKPYMCDVCGFRFTKNGHLKEHKRIHTGEKPYNCDVCGLAFMRSRCLKKHNRIHTKVKPYKCVICDFSTAHVCNLTIHKRIHTREKPYRCIVCGFSFAQNHHLKTHKRIHTGEKPYTCDVCGLAFMRSDYLKEHTKIHPREKTLQM